MRNCILLLLIFLSRISATAQGYAGPDTVELDEFFKPVPKAKVLTYTLPQIRIRKIRNYTPFQALSHYSPDDRRAITNPNRNSFFFTIGSVGINKYQIIKRGTIGSTHAILYRDSKYSQGKDVWLALYNPQQELWEKYYTGLTHSSPLHLKWDSQVPLFKDTNTIQIEAAYTREVHLKQNHYFPSLDLVEDGVVVEIDIARIMADSDRDGLTDVQEERLLLNPKKCDSDGDGVIDSLDPNPRFSLPRTEFTWIYEEVYYEPYRLDNLFYPIPFMPLKYAMYSLGGPDTFTYLIVSDDKDIQSIGLSGSRLIILTSEEYEAQKDFGLKEFRRIYFDGLTKVPGKDTYKIRVSSGPGGNEYTIRKGKNGWEVRHETFWIE